MFGVAVVRWSLSAKLLYIEPGQYLDGLSSLHVTRHQDELSRAIHLWVGAMSAGVSWEGNPYRPGVALAMHYRYIYISTYGLKGLVREMTSLPRIHFFAVRHTFIFCRSRVERKRPLCLRVVKSRQSVQKPIYKQLTDATSNLTLLIVTRRSAAADKPARRVCTGYGFLLVFYRNFVRNTHRF